MTAFSKALTTSRDTPAFFAVSASSSTVWRPASREAKISEKRARAALWKVSAISGCSSSTTPMAFMTMSVQSWSRILQGCSARVIFPSLTSRLISSACRVSKLAQKWQA